MKSKFPLLLMLCGFSLVAGLGRAATILHNPVLSAAAGEPVAVSASLSGVKPPVTVRLFFRAKGKELYQSEEMGGSDQLVSAEIPGSAVTAEGLEYYILVTDQNGRVTDPAVSPEMNPHFVSVRGAAAPAAIVILSPEDGEVVDSARPVITAGFKPEAEVNLNSVTLEIDGSAVSKDDFHVFSTLMTWIPDKDFAPGRHRIRVTAAIKGGSLDVAEWSFEVLGSGAGGPVSPRNWFYNGSLQLQTQYAGLLKAPDSTQVQPALVYRPYGANRGTFDLTARGPNQTYKLHAYVTDEDRTGVDQQPLDRYTASLNTDELGLTLGDYSPNFSELSLYNLYFMRGVTLDLHSGKDYEGHSRLIALGGITRYSVNPGSVAFLGGTATAASATFAQYLYGARWEVGSPKLFQLGMNAVTVNDDETGIASKAGIFPTYNTVFTSDAKLRIDPLYLTFEGEDGASLYLQDPSLLSAAVGTAYRAAAHLNILPTSTQADFEWRDLSGNFGFVPGGYISVANPGLVPDYRGFESSVSQAILGRSTINLAYNQWRNNLQGSQPDTTWTQYVSGFWNLNLENLPSLSLGYTQQDQTSDPSSDTIAANNRLANLNTSLAYNHLFGDMAFSGSLSWVHSMFTDNTGLAPNFRSDTAVISGYLSSGNNSLTAAISLGSTAYDATALSPGYQSINDSYSLRINRVITPGRWSGYLGWDLYTSAADALGQSSFRSTPCLGATFTRDTQHVDLLVAYAQVAQETGPGLSNAYDQVLGSLTYRYNF